MVAVDVVIATTAHNCLDAEAARELMIVLGFGAVVLATEDRVFAAAAINPVNIAIAINQIIAGAATNGVLSISGRDLICTPRSLQQICQMVTK